ncbi:MAG: hypothetical protein GF372_09380 [Candidatus Marinimicrobia bacterium]|nr:hypothetical protein [Candidatus Neomarinimicrobiota bacterium]
MNFVKYTRLVPRFSLRTVLAAVFMLYSFNSLTATETKFVKVGRYWVNVTDDGSASEASLTAGWFPADFNVTGNQTSDGSASGGGNLDLMVTDYVGPDGNTLPKVICTSISELNPDGTPVTPIQSFARYGLPTNTVNEVDVAAFPFAEVNPSEMIGTSEQVVRNIYEYGIGVQADRKVFAWSQPNHDDYVVVDVTFTNTGDQTLNNFTVAMEVAEMDYRYANGNNPSPSGLGTDSFRWRHYYGALPSDSQRVFYSYHADDPTSGGDNMANPAIDQGGRLINPDAQFYGFLHVSESPFTDASNDVNDPLQPKITYAAKGGLLGPSENNRTGLPLDASGVEWFDATVFGTVADARPMPGIPAGTHHEINNDEFGSSDFQEFSPKVTTSGYNGGMYSGVGPYATFAPGESIRLIYVVGSASLSLPVAKEVGEKMVDGTLQAPPGIPDPNKGYFPTNFVFPDEASQMDILKNLWYSTVIDTVHKIMYNARWNYATGWNVPTAPPPPVSFSVNGFPDNATITWSAPAAEALPNFAGYRLLRQKSNLDTAFFEVIATIPASETAETHTYEDSDVQFGASYYYYVQSLAEVDQNDPNALPNIRGKTIPSGRTYVSTPESIEPPRGGTETLTDIIIAPNPYNINAPNVQAQGWVDFRGIVFFNLPAFCEIDIYTEDGDLVKEIIHDSPVQAGSVRWDMITDSQQVISSGVYIATFTDNNGGVSFRKFVVAR